MRKSFIVLASLLLSVFMVLSGSSAFAADYAVKESITLSAGESQQRQFTIQEPLSIPEFEPLEAYVIIASGESGTLSISLDAAPEKAFGALLEFGLFGFGFSLDAGVIFFMEDATTPFGISASADINSTFGFVYTAAYIKDYTGDVTLPVPFTITFSLSAAPAPAE